MGGRVQAAPSPASAPAEAEEGLTFELSHDRGRHFTEAQCAVHARVFCDRLRGQVSRDPVQDFAVCRGRAACRDHVMPPRSRRFRRCGRCGVAGMANRSGGHSTGAATERADIPDVPAPAEQSFDRLRRVRNDNGFATTTARAVYATSARPPPAWQPHQGARTPRSWVISASVTVVGNIGYLARHSKGSPAARRKIGR